MNRNLLIITLNGNTPISIKWEIDLKKDSGKEYLKTLIKQGILYIDDKKRLVVDNTDDKLSKLFATRYQGFIEYTDRYRNDALFYIEYIDNNLMETIDLSTVLYATGGNMGTGKVRKVKLKYISKVQNLIAMLEDYNNGKRV